MLDLNCYQRTNTMFIKIRVSCFKPGFVIWGIIFGISGTFCDWMIQKLLLTWMTQPAILKPGSKQTCKDHLQTSPRQTMQDWQMKGTCMKRPNREELSFLMVLALPKASRMVLASRICCCTHVEMFAVTLRGKVESGIFASAQMQSLKV